ncbi:hypothetical protein JYK17_17605 [Streptomyces sp. KC 17012]|uniref:hypothetical protein n=1 Tax=Streptomyces plumbidurans TaxID=2814589 RepID=UPI001C9DD98E|nr:hypothetical protein [Streptomyces plumbidurans]MBY8341847.1 hypothetical protein [Streptomyces plumbidurans]
MSTSVTLHCNRQWAEGVCAAQLITDARSLDEARGVGRWLGWRTHPGDQDYCPEHSGSPAPTPRADVVQLHTLSQPGSDSPAAGLLPGDVVAAAARHLRTLAEAAGHDLTENAYWHSEFATREHWFANGVENALGGPAGKLAGLLSPANGLLLAQTLERHTRARAPIPAETFLLARNIHRSSQR